MKRTQAMNTTLTRLPSAAARAISMVFHPFLQPVYVMCLLMGGRAFAAVYTPEARIYIAAVVTLYTLILPALIIGLLKSTGRLQSLRLDQPRERILPLAAGAVCYIVCAVTVGRIPSADIIRRMMLAGACCETVCLLVTLRWKISLHMAAAGGCTAILMMLYIAGLESLLPAFAAAIVVSGMLASSRLYLGRHNLMQTAAGFAAGFFVTVAALLI